MNEYDKRMDEICQKYPLSETVIVRPPTSMMDNGEGVELPFSKKINEGIVHRFEVQRAMAHSREQAMKTMYPSKQEKVDVPVIRDYVIDGEKIQTMGDVKAIFSVMNVKFRNPDKETMDKLKHLFV